MIFERKNKIVYSLHKNIKISLAIWSMVNKCPIVYHNQCSKDDLNSSDKLIILVHSIELGGNK